MPNPNINCKLRSRKLAGLCTPNLEGHSRALVYFLELELELLNPFSILLLFKVVNAFNFRSHCMSLCAHAVLRFWLECASWSGSEEERQTPAWVDPHTKAVARGTARRIRISQSFVHSHGTANNCSMPTKKHTSSKEGASRARRNLISVLNTLVSPCGHMASGMRRAFPCVAFTPMATNITSPESSIWGDKTIAQVDGAIGTRKT